MNQFNSEINITDKNLDIFKNTKNYNDNNKENQTFKPYFYERNETKLTLRKKKLNETLLNKRKIAEKVFENQKYQIDKLKLFNISFTELISKIAVDYNDEEKLLELLNKISFVIEEKYRAKQAEINLNHNIYNFTGIDLIKNNWSENLFTLTKMYFNSEEVILYITRILLFSCLLINNDLEDNNNDNNLIIDEKDNINNNSYFISSDKYIDVYNKILEIYLKKNTKIAYNMVIFIGTIAKNNSNNQINLFLNGCLNYIIDSIDLERDSKNILEEKIWCLSKFELNEHYNINLDFSLSIQKIYIGIFNNKKKFELLEGINKEINDNNFLFNYLKVIENTSYCTGDTFVENFIKSNITKFLMDIINVNKDPNLLEVIISIFRNITVSDYYELGKTLIDFGIVQLLLNIINDKSIDVRLHYISMIPINNLLSDYHNWNIIIFDQKAIKTFCDILNDNNINQNLFMEVCMGIVNGIDNCDNNILNKLIDEYYVIQLVCNAFKQILTINKTQNIKHQVFIFFCSFILKFILEKDKDIIEKVVKIIQNIGGEEIIENIMNIHLNYKIDNCSNDEKGDIQDIVNLTGIINDILENYK